MKFALNTLVIAFSLGMLVSCGTKKIVGDGEGQTIKMKSMNGKAEIGRAKDDYDPFSITGSEIKGNTLILDVNYVGGCAEHTFSLVGSEMIAKSLPPIRSVRLLHNSQGDACKAVIQKQMIFDISNLAYKQESGSVIMLNIEGIAEPLKYTFK